MDRARWFCRTAILLVFTFATGNIARAADGSNAILEQLLKKGVSAEGQTVLLPVPTLTDGLSAAAQGAAIAQIADENHPVESLTRKSIVSPFMLRMSGSDGQAATGPTQRVDVWFVAYGRLDAVKDETLWKPGPAGADNSANGDVQTGRAAILTKDELRARHIEDPPDERHLTTELTLFNRVRLSATMEALQTRTAESVLVAGTLDPRFAADPQFPNSWRSLGRDDAGRLTVGLAQPYRALGWYVKVTQLRAPAGALFAEFHAAFEEPKGWFNGENFLRSKLPLVAQDGVRKFRRKLTDADRP
jgi:hypothetical protein